MKKFIAVMVFTLVALPVFGQNATKFSISGRALGYAGGGAKLVAADAVSKINISPKFSIRTDSVILSAAASEASLASFNVAGVEVPIPASKLIDKLGLDSSKYELYAVGEAGAVTNAAGTSRAFSAGIGANYHPASTPKVEVNLFEVRWLHGAVPIGNLPDGSPRYVRDGVALSVGVTF